MNDFLRFRKMITPLLIEVIFWIGVVVSVLVGLGEIINGMSNREYGGGTLVFTGLVTLVLGPLAVRIYCELIILLFRIHGELVGIREDRRGDR